VDSPISPAAEILQSLQPTTKTCHTIVRTARNAGNSYAPNVQTGIARWLAKPHVICMLEGCQVIMYILVRPSKPSTSIIITLYTSNSWRWCQYCNSTSRLLSVCWLQRLGSIGFPPADLPREICKDAKVKTNLWLTWCQLIKYHVLCTDSFRHKLVLKLILTATRRIPSNLWNVCKNLSSIQCSAHHEPALFLWKVPKDCVGLQDGWGYLALPSHLHYRDLFVIWVECIPITLW